MSNTDVLNARARLAGAAAVRALARQHAPGSSAERLAARAEDAEAAALRSITRATEPVRRTAWSEIRSHLDTEDYADSFRDYLSAAHGMLEPRQMDTLRWGEFRDLSDTTGASGAYAVPPAFEKRLSQALTFASPLRQVATVLTTPDGRTRNWPSTDDRAQGAVLLVENQNAGGLVADPSFASVKVKAFPFVSLIRYPRSLAQDVDGTFTLDGDVVRNPRAPAGYTGLGIDAIVADMFGSRFARGQNPYLTSGTGVNQPQGVTGCTVGATSAAPTAITLADLEALYHSVDPAYRTNGAFMVNDATFKAIEVLADSSLRPLFDPAKDLSFRGRPFIVNKDMDGLTATKISVVFGDFQRGYLIRDVQGVTVKTLDERFMDFLQYGAVGSLRTDGTLDDPAALRSLVQHA